MDVAGNSQVLNGNKEFGGLTAWLWNIEIFREQDLPLDYQLTMQSALILQMGGEAFLHTGSRACICAKAALRSAGQVLPSV